MAGSSKRTLRKPYKVSSANGVTSYLWAKKVNDPVTGEYRHLQPTRYMRLKTKGKLIRKKKTAGGKGG